MKKKSLLAIITVITIILPLYAQSRIVFETTTHNFKKVKQEKLLSHTFKFKNNGNKTLIIDRIKTG